MDLVSPGMGLVFWMTLIFLLLLFVLKKYGWAPILKSIHDREAKIADALAASARVQEEMQQQKQIHKELWEQAKAEREELLKTTRLSCERMVQEASQKATEDAAKIRQDAHNKTMAERQQMLKELSEKVVDISISLSEKILSQELSNKDQARVAMTKRLETMSLS